MNAIQPIRPTGSRPRRLGLGVLVVFTFLAQAACAKDAEPPAPRRGPSTWYVSSIVTGPSSYRITHYWSKGSSMRSETMIGVYPIVTIVRGDRYWVYNELLRQGIEITRAPLALEEDGERQRPFANDFEDLVRQNGERVETTARNGLPVEVWRVSTTAGRRTVWVTTGNVKLPVRVEIFDRETGETGQLEYSNWDSGFALPDRAFEPPADIAFQRFEYAQYLETAAAQPEGRAPILHPKLLHGSR